jgi:glycosyltransferase involved in cell wall biosynthesis
MKNNIKVSVVMAEFNTKREYLIQAIKSIINQTFQDFEIIIVDDNGINNINSIIREFNDNRIRVVRNDKNMGFALALNEGIKIAQGKYIVRMDTDDLCTVDRIEKIYKFIEENPQYDAVGSLAVEFSDNTMHGSIGSPGEKTEKNIINGDMLVHASTIIKRSTLTKIGMYKDYRRSQDFVLWSDILLNKGKLYCIDEVLFLYRVNPLDYKKRSLRARKYEIKAKLKYFPKLKASIFDYLKIAKSIIAGLLPVIFVRSYRARFVLGQDNKDKYDYLNKYIDYEKK